MADWPVTGDTVAYNVTIQQTKALPVAAVRRKIRLGEPRRDWEDALPRVREFISKDQPMTSDTPFPVMLYDLPTETDQAEVNAYFGVMVNYAFKSDADVGCAIAPAGETAFVEHVGDYAGLPAAHRAILEWAKKSKRKFAGPVWEVYTGMSRGQPRTAIYYLLAPNAKR